MIPAPGRPLFEAAAANFSLHSPAAVNTSSAVIPESGHNIALENPAALARAYLDFFAGS